MEYSLSDLASVLNGEVIGDGSMLVNSISSLESPKDGSVVVTMTESNRSKVPCEIPIVGPRKLFEPARSGVAVVDARSAMAVLLGLFRPLLEVTWGVDNSAVVHPEAKISEGCCIGPLCIVSKGAEVGPGTILRGRVFIGQDASVGSYSVIEPGVTVYDRCKIGSRVIIHANSVVGADGFGHIPASGDKGVVKVPQIGSVIIEDDVEIGACSSVDRGTIGDTVIGAGTKLDNHVQIGHNAVIGKNCIVISQAGMAGSSILEDRVILAAKSGVQEHIKIGKGAIVAACGGATKNVPPGAVVSGFPARDHRSIMRKEALLLRLEELFERVKRLEEKKNDGE